MENLVNEYLFGSGKFPLLQIIEKVNINLLNRKQYE